MPLVDSSFYHAWGISEVVLGIQLQEKQIELQLLR